MENEEEDRRGFISLEVIKRVEVIGPGADGRLYVNMHCKNVELLYQDNGTTLKIFLENDDVPPGV